MRLPPQDPTGIKVLCWCDCMTYSRISAYGRSKHRRFNYAAGVFLTNKCSGASGCGGSLCQAPFPLSAPRLQKSQSHDTNSGALSSAAFLPLWSMLLFTLTGWEREWNSPWMDISNDRKEPWCWHQKPDSEGWTSKEEGVSSNVHLVLKRVEHFSRPATFQSRKNWSVCHERRPI